MLIEEGVFLAYYVVIVSVFVIPVLEFLSAVPI